MLAVVAEESRRWSCIVIGEDLGTVPEGFRDTLSAWGVWSYLVMLFERECGRLVPPARANIPRRAIATFNTHDLPTFAGWMSGHDLQTKRAINVDPGETEEDRAASRVTLARALAAATGSQQIGFDGGRGVSRARRRRGWSRSRSRTCSAIAGSGQRAGHGRPSIRTGGGAGRCCWRSLPADQRLRAHRRDVLARRPRRDAGS